MKEKDLNKHIDKIIIDGLIKEAQQENLEFQAAMRKMSNEDFLELIMDNSSEKKVADIFATASNQLWLPIGEEKNEEVLEANEDRMTSFESNFPQNALKARIFKFDDIVESKEEYEQPVDSEKDSKMVSRSTNFRKFVPWISSALVAAACILAIVIPTVNSANGKLCESALMLSQTYMTTSKSSLDIANASVEEIKRQLPELENAYKSCIKQEGKFTIYSPGLQEAGWDLTLAYLKLHKKGKALEVLRVLAKQYKDTPFGRHCLILILQLY